MLVARAMVDGVEECAGIPAAAGKQARAQRLSGKQGAGARGHAVEGGVAFHVIQPVSRVSEIPLAAVDEIVKQVVVRLTFVRLRDFMRGVPVVVPQQREAKRDVARGMNARIGKMLRDIARCQHAFSRRAIQVRRIGRCEKYLIRRFHGACVNLIIPTIIVNWKTIQIQNPAGRSFMATSERKKGNTGKRYTEAQRKKILAFIEKRGRGGISAATREFGVSYIALRRWMQYGPQGAPRAERAKATLDGRRARRIKTALATVKELRTQMTRLQATLRQLLK